MSYDHISSIIVIHKRHRTHFHCIDHFRYELQSNEIIYILFWNFQNIYFTIFYECQKFSVFYLQLESEKLLRQISCTKSTITTYSHISIPSYEPLSNEILYIIFWNFHNIYFILFYILQVPNFCFILLLSTRNWKTITTKMMLASIHVILSPPLVITTAWTWIRRFVHSVQDWLYRMQALYLQHFPYSIALFNSKANRARSP